MALFNTYIPVNFAAGFIDYYAIFNTVGVYADGTGGLDLNPDGTYTAYLGSFTLDGAGIPVAGTINHVYLLDSTLSGTYFSLEYINLTLDTLGQYIIQNNALGLQSYVFSGDDTLLGSIYADGMFGYNGNDRLLGFSGNDFLNGNMGFDYVSGGFGDDAVFGGKQDDEVHGNEGNDLVCGDMGIDFVFGESGNDRLYGGRDNDVVVGAEGNDLLSGDRGNDTLNGGADADIYQFNPDGGHDVVQDFTAGQDRLLFSPFLAPSAAAVVSAASVVDGSLVITLGDMSVTLLNVTSISVDSIFIG